MTNINRLHNLKNPYQGDRIKTLCVCSAGLLRSPTLAHILTQEPYNRNTRAVGTSKEYALIPLEPYHLLWADEIICVDMDTANNIDIYQIGPNIDDKMFILNIPDQYSAFSEDLVEAINNELNRIKYK